MQEEKKPSYQTSTMATKSKKNAAAYIRVSTNEQQEKKNSPEEQIRCAKLLAKEKGFILKDTMIFEEARSAYRVDDAATRSSNGTSILSTDRPILKNLLKSAEKGEFSELIVYSRDRLTRNFQESIALKTLFKKLKIKIHFSRSGEYASEEDTTYDNFIEIILSSIGELESNVLSTRVKMGSKTNTLNGFWNGGKAPFGYETKQSTRKKQVLTESFIESTIIKEIFYYYNVLGYGYRKIASIIKDKYSEDIYNIKWTKNTIEWILKNENYTGYLIWGKRNSGDSNQIYRSDEVNEQAIIIDGTTWNIKNQIMEIKHKTKDSRYFDTPFLLKNKLICGKCKENLVGKNYGTNKNSVYRCPTLSDKKSELIIEINFIHNILFDRINEFFSLNTEIINTIWNLYIEKANKLQINREALTTELRKKIKKSQDFQEQLHKIKSNFTKSASKSSISPQEINEEADPKPDKKGSNNFNSKGISPIRTKTIGDAIEKQITTLSKEIIFLEEQLESIKKRNIPKFNSKKEFSQAIETLFKNLRYMNQVHQRLIVDLLIDKIIVDKIDDKLSLEVTIKTSSLQRKSP